MSDSNEHLQSDHKKGSEVFVGGLPRTITENTIREVFSGCGEILEIRLIQDKSGNLKGFGFVRFATKEAAEKAVKEKSGYVIEGKKIGVLPSIEQDTLYFGNLYKGWSAQEFENLIHQVFPDVASVNLIMQGDLQPGQKQRNRGFAFVKFSCHAAASRAYRLGSSSEFLLGNLHPAIQWAEEEPEIDHEELAKVKVAFVKNLPPEADEDYLRELFERFGKVEKIVLSRKGIRSVGFVHFDKRHDLDIAVNELNEKTVQGPNGAPSYKLQVEVARPMDKSKKRSRDETQSKIQNNSKHLKDELKGVEVSDPYEAAILSLPAIVNERLLRIMRLGIATRYDITIQSLARLRELTESTAISILDQFMLTGADVQNKRVYLDGLIAKQYVSRNEDAILKEPETVRYSNHVRPPVVDSYVPHLASTPPRSRSGLYKESYSPTFQHHIMQSLVTRHEETSLSPMQIRSSSSAYGRLGRTLYSNEESSPPMQRSLSPAAHRRVGATLRGAEEPNAHLQVPQSSAAAYGRVLATPNGAEETRGRMQVPLNTAGAYGRGFATFKEETSGRLPVPQNSAAAYERVLATLRGAAEEACGRLPVPQSSAASYGRVLATLKGAEEAASGRFQVPQSSSAGYERVLATFKGAEEEGSGRLQVPQSSAAATPYGGAGLNSYSSNAADRQPAQPKYRFDPFTGEPYKFDPFTGEPILPESSSHRF